ncbi:MAG: DUF4019 domain-containing protein [Verrucomicrobiae bacterium]|nr:DUF4019 domain-containing protein [Verrucomicrobiae bacterium]
MPRGARILAVLTIAAVMAGCSKNSVATAETGVKAFHDRFNAEQYEDIYSQAAATFRTQASHEKFQNTMTNMHAKLGLVRSSKIANSDVSWRLGGSYVHLTAETEFEHAQGKEEFLWRVKGSDAVLMGYNINAKHAGAAE